MKKAKQSSHAVIVTSESPARARKRFWMWLGPFLVIVAIALVVAGFFAWRDNQTGPDNAQTTNATLKNLYAGNLDLQDPAAHDKLLRAFELATTSKDKMALLKALGDNAQYLKKYQSAIDYYKQGAKQGDHSSGMYIAIATLYAENIHDKSNALKYYKLALGSAKTEAKTEPYGDRQINFVQTKIKELEGQGAQ